MARAVHYAVGQEQGLLALEAAKQLRAFDLLEAERLARLAVKLRPDDPEALYLTPVRSYPTS